MSVGTAIFLSSLMFAVVILYGITKDRWRWREFSRVVGQVFAGLVIGTVVILILAAIAQQFER
jgi:hypothetical protein